MHFLVLLSPRPLRHLDSNIFLLTEVGERKKEEEEKKGSKV